MTKKILILTGDAVEALEVYYPYYRCLEEGFDVTIAAPSVKKIQTVSMILSMVLILIRK